MSEPRTFLSRVYDAKHRFMREYGIEPKQIFLGPAEMLELHDYIQELKRNGFLIADPEGCKNHGSEIAGMTIIDLTADGMRAGICSPP